MGLNKHNAFTNAVPGKQGFQPITAGKNGITAPQPPQSGYSGPMTTNPARSRDAAPRAGFDLTAAMAANVPSSPKTSRISQRTDDFRGGVANGTSATSVASRKLEQNLRDVAEQHAHLYPNLTWRAGYSAIELCRKLGAPESYLAKAGNDIAGMYPDGGIWEDAQGRPVVIAEAKKQGVTGNAIERWYKNWTMARRLNPDVIYLTFCTGKGFYDDNSAQRTLQTAVTEEPGGWDRLANGTLWNTHTGNTRLYRHLDHNSTVELMGEALKAALSSVAARGARRPTLPTPQPAQGAPQPAQSLFR
jgi:hypothetical protein